jgi:hypothetical protein
VVAEIASVVAAVAIAKAEATTEAPVIGGILVHRATRTGDGSETGLLLLGVDALL